MSQAMRPIFLLGLIGVVAACGWGTDFVRPDADAFELGKTTYDEVVQRVGSPRSTGEMLQNGKSVKTISYSYAHAHGEPSEEGVIPARSMTYYFWNDKLIGQAFVSSFKSDNSNFDDSKISAITKGTSTRADVVQLLGRPSGSYISPMVKGTAVNAFVYNYLTTRGGVIGGFKAFQKVLVVSFDDQGRVSDTEYVSGGGK